MGQLEPEGLTNDMVRLFRRPSIAPTEEVRRRTQAELTSLEVQLSESSKTRISTLSPNTEQKRGTETVPRKAKLDETEDMEKIMSLQYTINFDVVFNVDYTTRTTTLSSIDLMKQEIEEQYKQKSDTDFQVATKEPRMSVFVELRRKKLVHDVWHKQHQYRVPYSTLMDQKAVHWLEASENHLANSDAKAALSALEKFLFYRPNKSRAYVLKSVAFQQLKDLRMATMAIKMAQELGLAPDEEKALQFRLASIEFKQAEKLRQKGDLPKAIERYKLASEIIDNYEDSLVIIIKLHFELGNTETAMKLLDQQIELEPDRLELRVWRTRQLLDMNELNICHAHLDTISSIDPNNSDMLSMRRELRERAEKHQKECVMMMAANHLKDALREIEYAIGAAPKNLHLYLLRAKIYRRLQLWEDAIRNLEMISGSGDELLEKESKNLALAIFNDFGVDCIKCGYYKNAIKLFTVTISQIKGHRNIHLNRGDCYLRLGDLENALRDYEIALNNSFHENSCRLIRNRISVVFHEFGMGAYQKERYDVADHYFSKAIHYQVLALYLIHRSRVRIMLGNEFLAKADAIAAYELEPTNEDLVPVLARLFPDDSIPAVDKYRNRFFPQIKVKNDEKGGGEMKLEEIGELKDIRQKKELISFGELRSALMHQTIPKLPSIKSDTHMDQKTGWKKFSTGINT